MSTRTARLGFYGLAFASGVLVVGQVAVDLLLSRARSSGDVLALSSTLDLVEYVTYACQIGLVVAAFMASQLPATVRVRVPMTSVGVLGLVVLVIHIAQRTVTHGMSVEALTSFFKWTWAGKQLLSSVMTALAGLALQRVGKAANAKRCDLIAALATVPLLALDVLAIANTLTEYELLHDDLQKLIAWTFELAALVQAIAFGWAGVQAGRIRSDAAAEPANGPISAEWRKVSAGIWIYLVALIIRLAVAGLLYATMAGAADAYDSVPRRQGIHDSIVLLGIIGGLGGVLAIVGVAILSRAPSERVRGPAIGAIACMFLGLILDGSAAWLSASAMNSVSDAFTAMDLLPILAAFTTSIGAIGAWAIFRALGSAAGELGRDDVEKWARTGGFCAIVAGGFGAVAQLAIKGIPAEIVLVAAFVIAPAALFAAAQMLRVMLVLSSAIEERSNPR